MFRKVVVGLFTVVVIVFGVAAWRWYTDNRRPNFRVRTELFVFPGMTCGEVLARLPDSVTVSRRSLERVFRKHLMSADIRPGHYVLDPSCSSIYAARMLKAGWQTPVHLVLSGTMRRKNQLARKISNQLLLDSASVYQALDDTALLACYGFTPSDVFSLFLPDTYEMYWTATMKEVLDRQKEAYDAFWTAERKERARHLGLTPKEVSIVASIVAGESNYKPEYPSIAGVYLNRYRIGMKLQADPTVAYCFDYTLNRVLRRHLEVDSPYNTYKYEGLPPGPICVPDKACLEAVLNPDRHGYLFFCASAAMDGTHCFAKTFSEHVLNARAFQRALDARQ